MISFSGLFYLMFSVLFISVLVWFSLAWGSFLLRFCLQFLHFIVISCCFIFYFIQSICKTFPDFLNQFIRLLTFDFISACILFNIFISLVNSTFQTLVFHHFLQLKICVFLDIRHIFLAILPKQTELFICAFFKLFEIFDEVYGCFF